MFPIAHKLIEENGRFSRVLQGKEKESIILDGEWQAGSWRVEAYEHEEGRNNQNSKVQNWSIWVREDRPINGFEEA